MATIAPSNVIRLMIGTVSPLHYFVVAFVIAPCITCGVAAQTISSESATSGDLGPVAEVGGLVVAPNGLTKVRAATSFKQGAKFGVFAATRRSRGHVSDWIYLVIVECPKFSVEDAGFPISLDVDDDGIVLQQGVSIPAISIRLLFRAGQGDEETEELQLNSTPIDLQAGRLIYLAVLEDAIEVHQLDISVDRRKYSLEQKKGPAAMARELWSAFVKEHENWKDESKSVKVSLTGNDDQSADIEEPITPKNKLEE
jgi:hypothetical protein